MTYKIFVFSSIPKNIEDCAWYESPRSYPIYQVLGEQSRTKFEAENDMTKYIVSERTTETPFLSISFDTKIARFEPQPYDCFNIGERKSHTGQWLSNLFYAEEFKEEAKALYARMSAKNAIDQNEFYERYYS